MNKREYLRSLGFDVGERGRFSAEMLEALKDFKEPEKRLKPKQPGNKEKRRDNIKFYVAKLTGGQVIKFDTCAQCKEYYVYCKCSDPQPAKWLRHEVASWNASE